MDHEHIIENVEEHKLFLFIGDETGYLRVLNLTQILLDVGFKPEQVKDDHKNLYRYEDVS